MIFYNTIFASIVFLTLIEESFIKRNQRPIVDIIMVLILCIVSALHGIGGKDYEIYYAAYKQVPTISDVIQNIGYTRRLLFNFEPGYIIIISFIKSLGFDFYGYTVIQAIVFYGLMYFGLRKYTSHFGILLLIFAYKMFFYDTFVSMRQPITIAVFFVIMKYIYEGQTIRFFIWSIVLASIHNGAFILFPLYFIRYFNLNKNRLIFLSLLFLPTAVLSNIGMGASINSIMSIINSDKGTSYGESTEVLNIAYTIEYYLIMLLVICNYKSIIQLKYGDFIVKIFLVMLPLVTLFSGVIILRRELDYFFFTYGIIGGYICDVRPKIKSLIIAAYIAISYYGYQRYLTNFDQGGLIPYQTWIETKR